MKVNPPTHNSKLTTRFKKGENPEDITGENVGDTHDGPTTVGTRAIFRWRRQRGGAEEGFATEASTHDGRRSHGRWIRQIAIRPHLRRRCRPHELRPPSAPSTPLADLLSLEILSGAFTAVEADGSLRSPISLSLFFFNLIFILRFLVTVFAFLS